MANTTNPWVGPYQRSFTDIKGTILNNMRANAPEITDLTEGNIFVIIISIFAGIAEVLHYYIDSMARETFFPTARKYESLLKHSNLVDYRARGANASMVDIILSMDGNQPFPYGANGKQQRLTIPLNTQFTSSDGKVWLSAKTVSFISGMYNVLIPLVQKRPSTSNLNSNIEEKNKLKDYDGSSFIYLSTSSVTEESEKILDNSVVLYVGIGKDKEGNNIWETWTRVDTFAYYGPGDKVFKFSVDSSQRPYIIFGDGKFGARPTLNSPLRYDCYYTYGAAGNMGSGSIKDFPNVSLTNLVNEEGQPLTDGDFLVTQINPSAGGINAEDFDMLKRHIPLSVKTLGVAITKEDYQSIVELIPGVNKAYVDYHCGKLIDIYVTSIVDGENPYGIASDGLLIDINNRLQQSKVITTLINVHSTYETHIWLEATVTGRKSFNKSDIQNQIKQALINNYNYLTSDINKVVRLSDVYGIIENCSMVDYVEITNMYLLSNPQRIDSDEIIELESGESLPTNDIRLLNITSYNLSSFKLPDNPEPGTDFYYDLYITMGKDDSFKLSSTLDDSNTGYTIQGDTEGTIGTEVSLKAISDGNTLFEVSFIIDNWDEMQYAPDSKYIMRIQPRFSDKAGSTMDLYPLDFNTPVFLDNTINLTINETV